MPEEIKPAQLKETAEAAESNERKNEARKLYEMTPREITEELDKYIIGQDNAKKSVAVALRNRYRRSLLDEKMREEITPKNILMVGPTGVGKTEIARRLAKLMSAPFVKVEATKFTEVGYVGRDVDSMIRDLVEASIRITKQQKLDEKYKIAEGMAIDRIVRAMVPGLRKKNAGAQNTSNNPFEFIMKSAQEMAQGKQPGQMPPQEKPEEVEEKNDQIELTREQVKKQIMDGALDEEYVEVDISENPAPPMLDMNEGQVTGIAIGNIFEAMNPQKKTRKKKVKVKDAKKILTEEEAQNLIDMEQVKSEALENAEQNGIIFIDEIDKIASDQSFRSGANVSREGVQRDILPIVEGSVVNTKYGPVKTDHILFVGAGAFHVSKPTDLIPELQGRFPIRVELENLTEEAFYNILTVPKNALIKQHKALLETEGVKVDFKDEAVREIAKISFMTNEQTENIGARRLHTIMEKLLEEISFNISDNKKDVVIDKDYVDNKFIDRIKADDIDRYIL
jgi:ATP-dependent HslUV protease ATP-binding subunit HslU